MGFTDRINDTLRGARTALGTAELRQRLAEAELARDRALARIGEAVCAAYAGAEEGDVDPRFLDAWRQAEVAAQAIEDLQSQLDALVAVQVVGPTRFCGSCGAQISGSAAFCPSCGAPAA